MPETESMQEPASIDSRVGSLLKEAHAAAERVEGTLNAPAPSEAGGEPAPAPGASPSAPPVPAAEAAPTLDDSFDISQLDDDLARLTESLIAQEQVAPAAGAEVAPPAPVPEAKAPAPPPAPAPASAPEASPGPVAPAPAQAPAPAPAPAPTPPPHPARAPEPVVAAPRPAAVAKDRPRVSDGLLRVFGAASGPLLKQSPVVRDTAGWLAMWTFFLAACVWGYLLLLHKPAPPETSHAPIEMVTEDRPPVHAVADKDAAGEQPKAEHAAEAPKAAEHH